MYNQLIFEITGIKSNKISKKRVEISIKDFCFLNAVYEVNKFENIKEKEFLTIKNVIDIDKKKDSYSAYGNSLIPGSNSNEVLNKELHRGKITKTIIEPMIEKGILDNYDEKKIKIDMACHRAKDILEYSSNKFEESFTFQQELKILFEKLRQMSIEDLKIVYQNIRLYCFIDMYDWIMLGLWQKVRNQDKKELIDFIDSIKLSNKDRYLLKNIKFKKYYFKSSIVDVLKDSNKNKALKKIKQKLDGFFKSNKNQMINYYYLMNLSKRIEYLIYLTNTDWILLKKFSRLQNYKNKKKYYQKKIWCIKYAKGLIFESFIK